MRYIYQTWKHSKLKTLSSPLISPPLRHSSKGTKAASELMSSWKHAYIILTHFYIVKLGFTGVYIIFKFLLKNIDCGYSLEPPRRGGSNEYPQSMFWADIWKYQSFLSENFQFLEKKFSRYLHWHVFVMFYLKLFPARIYPWNRL